MNAIPAFAFPQHWTSQDLADAVPLRLFELFAFDAASAELHEPALRQPPRRAWHRGYLAAATLPATFRIHN